MIRFTMVVGLPCSGKSVMGKTIAETTGALFIDDPKDFEQDVREKIKDNREVVIADPHLCKKSAREAAEAVLLKLFPYSSFEWIYFENNPEKAMINMEYRISKGDTREVRSMISLSSRNYEIPADAHVLNIWQPEKNS